MKPWPTKLLGEIADVFNGKTPPKAEQRASGHPVLKIKDVDEDGNFRGRHESFVDPVFATANEKKKVCSSDVLILNAAHNAGYVASKVFFANDEVKGTLATGEWTIIRANPASLNPGFVHHWVRSQIGRTLIKSLVRGIHLYPSDVASIRFPVPPLIEQERIVKRLDEADELRKLRSQADCRTTDLVPSLLDELFGDQDTKGWKERIFGDPEIMQIVDGDRGTNYPKKTDFHGTGYCLFLNTSNVRNGAFDFSKCEFITHEKDRALRKGKLTRGDVVLTTRGTLGNSSHYDSAVLHANVRINSGMVILRTNPALLLPEYLLVFLNSNEFTCQVNTMVSGSAQPQLPINRLSHIKLILPPLPLQEQLIQRVKEIRALEAEQAVSRRRLDDLFKSMLQHAFNEEL